MVSKMDTARGRILDFPLHYFDPDAFRVKVSLTFLNIHIFTERESLQANINISQSYLVFFLQADIFLIWMAKQGYLAGPGTMGL